MSLVADFTFILFYSPHSIVQAEFYPRLLSRPRVSPTWIALQMNPRGWLLLFVIVTWSAWALRARNWPTHDNCSFMYACLLRDAKWTNGEVSPEHNWSQIWTAAQQALSEIPTELLSTTLCTKQQPSPRKWKRNTLLTFASEYHMYALNCNNKVCQTKRFTNIWVQSNADFFPLKSSPHFANQCNARSVQKEKNINPLNGWANKTGPRYRQEKKPSRICSKPCPFSVVMLSGECFWFFSFGKRPHKVSRRITAQSNKLKKKKRLKEEKKQSWCLIA